LLPDPQGDYYCLSALVQFTATNEGEAGVYFLAEERATPQGPEHVFFALTFADRGLLAPRVRLQMFHYREKTATKGLLRLESTFRETVLGRKTWHELTVKVRRKKISATCDGKAFKELDLDDPKEAMAMRWSQLHLRVNPSPPPVVVPRSGLGLFVRRGTASVKNVVVTPLQPDLAK
jgi:hypothetical protein